MQTIMALTAQLLGKKAAVVVQVGLATKQPAAASDSSRTLGGESMF
jgi:hypothetical protein